MFRQSRGLVTCRVHLSARLSDGLESAIGAQPSSFRKVPVGPHVQTTPEDRNTVVEDVMRRATTCAAPETAAKCLRGTAEAIAEELTTQIPLAALVAVNGSRQAAGMRSQAGTAAPGDAVKVPVPVPHHQ